MTSTAEDRLAKQEQRATALSEIGLDRQTRRLWVDCLRQVAEELEADRIELAIS